MIERLASGWAVKGSRLLAGWLIPMAIALPSVAAQIGAHVEVLDCAGTTQDGGFGSSSAAASSNACGSASGSAHLASGNLELHMTSGGPGYGVSGYAWLQDSLTFAGIPVGGFVDVTVTISGGWGGSFDWSQNADFQVEYDLLLGALSASNNFSKGIASANLAALIQSQGFSGTCGGPGSNCPGPTTTGPYFGEVGGGYSFSRTWQVYYFGGPNPQLDLFAAIKAEASNGAYGFIDHPLVVSVDNPNVSFASQSGNPYAVPEPDTLLLLGSGLVVLAVRRGRARKPF